MSGANLFQEVLTNAQGVEERMLGPTYPYYKNIKAPSEIGMSDKGTIQQMSKNVEGLIEYVELLVTGNSRASSTGKPLGNKFFLQTGAKCQACDDPDDPNSCRSEDRYIYVNNVPVGNVPFISSGMGVNFSEFKGLIPGAMGNLNTLNPYGLMRAFLTGANPPCQPLTMETIDSNNTKSSETHYVTLADIQSMDPCIFPNGRNPATGQKCRETFQTRTLQPASLPDDPLAQTYFAGLGLLGVFLLYKLMDKA